MARLHFWMGLLAVVTAGAVMSARAQAGEPDTTPPVITIIGGTEIAECGSYPYYIDPGATALDAVDGEVEVSADLSLIDQRTPGQYYVLYTATDKSGNTSQAARWVFVSDTQPPYVELQGDETVMLYGGQYWFPDPGAYGYDACDGLLIATRVNDPDPLDYSCWETERLDYLVEDSNGNFAWTYRYIRYYCGETWCSDFDNDGLPDDLFVNCPESFWNFDVDMGSCTRHVIGDGYVYEPQQDHTSTFYNPGHPDQAVTITVPAVWWGAYPELVVSFGCPLPELLSDQYNNLGDIPDLEMPGNTWLFVALLVRDGYSELRPITNEELAIAPLLISMKGVTLDADSAGYFAVGDGTIGKTEYGGATFSIPVGSDWNAEESQYEAGTLTGTLTHLGAIGALQRPLAAGRLRLSPEPNHDLLFGLARVNSAPSSRLVRMTNTGEMPLTATVSRGGSSEFAVTAGSFTLGPGESREFSVTFRPSRIGEAVGQLVVFTEQDGPQAYTLRGVGLYWDDSHKGFLGCGRVSEGSGAAGDLVVLLAALGLIAGGRLRLSR